MAHFVRGTQVTSAGKDYNINDELASMKAAMEAHIAERARKNVSVTVAEVQKPLAIVSENEQEQKKAEEKSKKATKNPKLPNNYQAFSQRPINQGGVASGIKKIHLIPWLCPEIDETEELHKFEMVCRTVAEEIKETLLYPTENWKDKPAFRKNVIMSGQSVIAIDVTLIMGTKGSNLYSWIDAGTNPRVIGVNSSNPGKGGTHRALKMDIGFKGVTGGSWSRKRWVGSNPYVQDVYNYHGIGARKFFDAADMYWEEAFPNLLEMLFT